MKRWSVRFYPQLFVGGLVSYLRHLCLFAHRGVKHIVCCVFLRLVYPMLPVSLDCPFLIVPSVFSNVYVLFFPSSDETYPILFHVTLIPYRPICT
jgi:hypothetical protein